MKHSEVLMNEPCQHIKRQSHLASTTQIFNAHQMHKLLNNDEPVFLAAIWTRNEKISGIRGLRSGKRINKRSPSYAAVNSAYSMTGEVKRNRNEESSPNKDIISI